ncbi:hypothetical protein [Micromonospora globbae]|jgi:hypothetical protein|uniref:hypothetical protein n=1 Tax=Micromonospora globbae TaxID=1894969 RepID=UPI003417D079
MGITGGIACVFLAVLIAAAVVYWGVQSGFIPNKPRRSQSEVLEPPEDRRDRG